MFAMHPRRDGAVAVGIKSSASSPQNERSGLRGKHDPERRDHRLRPCRAGRAVSGVKDEHRGPHPSDAKDFARGALAELRSAVADLSWLLERGYTDVAGVKLVGDRYGLTARQRAAVTRCACGASACASRLSREVVDLQGAHVDVDAFNVIILLERGLSGGPVLVGRDGACRDLGRCTARGGRSSRPRRRSPSWGRSSLRPLP